jgi:hypothetical protein
LGIDAGVHPVTFALIREFFDCPLSHHLQRSRAEMTFVHLSADLGRAPISLAAAAHTLKSHPPSTTTADASPKSCCRPLLRPRRQPVLRASAVQEVVSPTLSAIDWKHVDPRPERCCSAIHASLTRMCTQAEAPSWGPVTEIWTTKSKTDYDSLQARFKAADIDG